LLINIGLWIFLFIELARIPAWIIIVIWFLLQLGSGLASLGPAAASAGVAYLAHVGGFITGMLLVTPAWLSGRRARFAGWGG
jgi:membrane associated rhomboid family serine protease